LNFTLLNMARRRVSPSLTTALAATLTLAGCGAKTGLRVPDVQDGTAKRGETAGHGTIQHVVRFAVQAANEEGVRPQVEGAQVIDQRSRVHGLRWKTVLKVSGFDILDRGIDRP
jgi:predicted small lipoprotein YifL